MVKTMKSQSLLTYFSIFLILAASAGYYCRTRSQTFCFLISTLATIILILTYKRIRINKKVFLCCCTLICLGLLSSVIAGDALDYMFAPIVALLTGLLIVSALDYNVFRNVYVSVIMHISIVSIIAEILFIVAPYVITQFPIVINNAGGGGYNLLYCVVSFNYGHGYRIQGIFWEPGAFQFFLTLALLFLLYDTRMVKRRLKSVILVVAMIMTFSTTAYISLLVLYFLYLRLNGVNKKILSAVIVSLLVIPIAIFCIPNFTQLLTEILGAKIGNFIKAFDGDSANISSTVRADSIIYPFQLFLSNPLFGGGYSGLLGLSQFMGHAMTTCTPLNYFATYGVVYGGIMMYLFYRLSVRIPNGSRGKWMIFILLIIITFSEDFNGSTIINIFLLYGLLDFNCSQIKILDKTKECKYENIVN